MKRRGRRAATLLVIGVVALTATMAGFAYWTSTGESSGAVSTSSGSSWSVAVGAASGGPLTPNGPYQQVGYAVTNTSSGNQYLNGVTVSVANSDGSPWSSGTCDAGDFALNDGSAGASLVDTRLAGSFGASEAESATVYVQLVDNPAQNQNDCKGVNVPLRFVAS